MTALAGLIIYKVASREASPGPGWLRVGSVADIERQGVTKVDHSAYVVSYRDLPVYAFAASYVDGIHEVVSYCSSSGWFYNEPHATQFNIVGRYMLGPAPSSTLPRVAVTVLDGEVWVNPEQKRYTTFCANCPLKGTAKKPPPDPISLPGPASESKSLMA